MRLKTFADYAVMLAVILVIVVETIRLIDSNSSNIFSSSMRYARVSFRKVSGLIALLPFLKFMIADLATPDWRERPLLENIFDCVRISSRYFASTILSYSRHVSSAGSTAPASASMDGSGPPAQRVDASLPMK